MNKKFVGLGLIFIAIGLIVTGGLVGRNSNYKYIKMLQGIVDIFNKGSVVEEYTKLNNKITVTSDSNGINFTLVNSEGNKKNFSMLLDGSILSLDINLQEDNMFDKIYIGTEIFDIVGQIHGYNEGDLSRTLNSEKSNTYTLEKEGFGKIQTSEKLQIKIDLSKKVPLVDFSEVYIEPSDIESYKEYISGDGSAEKSKGNIWFNKSGYDGNYTLLVAEKNGLTSNAYKSILSILEVMFSDNKVIEYFNINYPEGNFVDKSFAGFDIKVNPEEKTSWEETLIPSDSDYKFIRITIDKNAVMSAVGITG